MRGKSPINKYLIVSIIFLAVGVPTAYAAIGDFISSFSCTTGGGTSFGQPLSVTVDSNDRIIVADNIPALVQIFDSTGSFLDSFNGTTGGGTQFVVPHGVTVDSIDRIIVGDINLSTVQIFNSTGSFLSSFDGTTGGGTQFSFPFAVTVDSNDRIIVGDNFLGIVQIFEGFTTMPCSPPTSGDWVVSLTCTMTGDATADGNVIVPNGVVLTIPNGVTLDINFATKNLTVRAGGGVLIQAGGTIT